MHGTDQYSGTFSQIDRIVCNNIDQAHNTKIVEPKTNNNSTMIRTAAFIALAASAASFQPMSARPAFVGHRALHMSNKQEPYYASYKSNTLERPTVQEENVVDTHPPAMERQEMTTDPVEQLETKKAPKKTTPAKGGHGKDGVFSPMVLFVKGIMGDQLLNKVRGKVISLHSDVIGSFVDTSSTAFGDAVLRSLFRLADKDESGTIDKEELQVALQSLGFTWLEAKQVDGIFKRADADGNGSIEMDEWMAEAPKTLRTNLIKLAKKNGGEMGLLA